MAWTAPLTWVPGSIPTAALLNAQLRDNLLETMPAKATLQGSIFVATGSNAIAERSIDFARVDTSQTTTSTSYTDLATVGPTVTLTTGTKALVFHSCHLLNSTVDVETRMSWAVSGATTTSANDDWSLYLNGVNSANTNSGGIVDVITSLNAGSNTFTAKYRVSAGTGTFIRRIIGVIPLS